MQKGNEMNYKLTIIYENGETETAVYPTEEIAIEHENGIHIALGNQVQFTCVMPTSEPVTVFENYITETSYSKNPLDDIDWDEDDEDYFFDIPSDAF